MNAVAVEKLYIYRHTKRRHSAVEREYCISLCTHVVSDVDSVHVDDDVMMMMVVVMMVVVMMIMLLSRTEIIRTCVR